MKNLLLSSFLGMAMLTGCSTAYKAGQTPDDVYYSPGRDGLTAKEETRQRQEQEEYEEYISSQDDRYLRMKVANRSRWASIDDYSYWYDSRYDFSNYNNYAFYNPWYSNFYLGISYYGRPYWGGGYYGWNNPYYTLVYYGTPKYGGGGGYTSGSNLSAYKNRNYNNSNTGYRDKAGNFVPAANNSNFGSLLKRVFTSSPNGNTNSFDRPARTFDNNSRSTSTPPATNSNAGGTSGGFQSTGSSTSTGRGGRG